MNRQTGESVVRRPVQCQPRQRVVALEDIPGTHGNITLHQAVEFPDTLLICDITLSR